MYFCDMKEGNQEIHIEHPEVWNLLVSIDDRQVDYILYTPTVAGSLIVGSVPRGDESLQALEDAVYDSPQLLNEYKQVSVVVHSNHFVLLPGETGDVDCLSLVRQAFPADDGDAAVCQLPASGAKVAWLMPSGMKAFLGRTFSYPEVCHHLLPLCEHFAGLEAGDDVSRMFLNLRPDSMDMAIYRGTALQRVNTYPYTSHEDAAYYALNAWRTYGLDQLSDELQLMGDREACAAMTPRLREFVKYVMPAVYPAAAMRLGRNAMQAPLELILLALCE